MNKYEIAENLTLGSPLMCLMEDESATKKVICKAMEYIEENKLKMSCHSLLGIVLLMSDEEKENTIAIQRHAIKEAGYSGWGGIYRDGPFDGPDRDLFAFSMYHIQIMGWEKWIASLHTKEQRKAELEEQTKSWIEVISEKLVEENRFISTPTFRNVKPDEDGHYKILLNNKPLDRATAGKLSEFKNRCKEGLVLSEHRHPLYEKVNDVTAINTNNSIVKITDITYYDKNKYFIIFKPLPGKEEIFDKINAYGFYFAMRGVINHLAVGKKKLVNIITFDINYDLFQNKVDFEKFLYTPVIKNFIE